jgi:hypothetical protein
MVSLLVEPSCHPELVEGRRTVAFRQLQLEVVAIAVVVLSAVDARLP